MKIQSLLLGENRIYRAESSAVSPATSLPANPPKTNLSTCISHCREIPHLALFTHVVVLLKSAFKNLLSILSLYL